jgi:predicted transcriptional regulator
MAQDIIRRREQVRCQILKAVIEESGGNDMKPVAQDTIVSKIGLSSQEVGEAVGPMIGDGLLKGGVFEYRITEPGIRYFQRCS